jgi:peptidoglycan/LPS O-acetylase OafA/YrhL
VNKDDPEVKTYRPDIDGLRFLAVLPVMFYHAGIPGFSGGYIGVDVFFVISGYLITGIIIEELDQGSFSLHNFYERRARRILPALFTVILCSTAVAAIVALPAQFATFGKSALATVFFSSNIFFWGQDNYFGGASEMMPLLHTWSLAVEEQFYLLFPPVLIMIVTWRPTARTYLLSGVCLASIAVGIYGVAHHPSAAFYLPPARVWELLLGSLLVLGHFQMRIPTALHLPLGIAGLLCISIPVAVYSKDTGFPGLAALPPCIGTSILLHIGAKRQTMVTRLLSLRPLVLLGLISYSLYLWHWPVLVFLRLYLGEVALGTSVGLLAIAFSTVMAFLSWRYIERPFRTKGFLSRRRIFTLAAAISLVVAVLGGAISQQNGFPFRFSPRVNQLADAARNVDPRSVYCPGNMPSGERCRIGSMGDVEVDFLLWGDSHAAAVLPAVDYAAKFTGHAGYFVGDAACPPLIGVVRLRINMARQCRDFNYDVLSYIEAQGDRIKLVILAGRWAQLADGQSYMNESGRGVVIIDNESTSAGPTANLAVFERGLRRTVTALVKMGKSVVILGDAPEVGWHVPFSLAAAEAWQRKPPTAPTSAEVARRNVMVDAVLKRVGAVAPFRKISLAAQLCPGECKVTHQGYPVYIDDDHLSAYGAVKLVGPALVEQIWALK